MRVVSDRVSLADARASLAGQVAVVMTMGALHSGHATLVRAASEIADSVIVTIFVNPLQFGVGEDLDRYPRSLEDDLLVCATEGADLVYAPDVKDVYGGGTSTRIEPGELGGILEGASRSGHFAGMLTVVAKLMHRTRPDHALFGEKDYQQLVLIRHMVRDLDFPVQVRGVPTVRDADGLALSSRNRYLDGAQRSSALALPAALRAAAEQANRGPETVLDTARRELADTPGLDVDYVALRGPDLEATPAEGAARLLAAVRVGRTRLIDNLPLELKAAPAGSAYDARPAAKEH